MLEANAVPAFNSCTECVGIKHDCTSDCYSVSGRTVLTFYSCTSRPDVYHRLVTNAFGHKCQRNKPSTPISHVSSGLKPHSVVRSSLHPCPDNRVAIGRAVVYYARAAHVFFAEIKCRHCRCFHRSLTTVLAFNNCTRCVGSPGIKHDCTPDCHPDFWTWRPPQVPASQPISASICKLLESLMCLAYFLKCYS